MLDRSTFRGKELCFTIKSANNVYYPFALNPSSGDIIMCAELLVEIYAKHFPEHALSDYKESLISCLRDFQSLKVSEGCISYIDYLIVNLWESKDPGPGDDGTNNVC